VNTGTGSTLTMGYSSVSGNRALGLGSIAGGLDCIDDSTAHLIGTSIQNNSATVKGGGFYLTGASLTLEDCTLTGNTAPTGPGGVKRSDSIYDPIRGTLTDSVVEEP
jgi:hypothetical protein